MRGKPKLAGAWTAYAVAVLLALQAVLLAFTGGAEAAPAARDRFGNVLCTADAAGRHDAPREGHATAASCCTLGCPMLGGPVPPGGDVAQPVLLRFVRSAGLDPQTHLVRAAPAAAPLNARAPPSAARA